MTTNYDNHEHIMAQPGISPQPLVSEPASVGSEIISFRAKRQTLVTTALVLLVAISVFETIELARLHQALRIWQTLPAASAAAPAPASGAGALPAQVGGC